GLAEVAGRRLYNAALSLERLDEEGRVTAAGECPAQGVEIAVRYIVESRYRRAERLLVLLLVRGRERAERLAMEAVAGGEDVVTAGRGAAQLDGGLDGLGAAVGEGHVRH